jgi:hypothetical protein
MDRYKTQSYNYKDYSVYQHIMMVLYMCQHVARQSVVHPMTELLPKNILKTGATIVL